MLAISRRGLLGSTAAVALASGAQAGRKFVRRGVPSIAGLRLNNVSPKNHYSQPNVSYGHAFADGDVPAGGSVTLSDSRGDPIVVQMDAVALWSSGCPRFVVLSHNCPENFAPGDSKSFTIGSSTDAPNNTPASEWGNSPETTLAANTNFLVEYSGFDAGANTYTVSLNRILSTYRSYPWGTRYPSGGWERTKVGPVCMEWHAWQYLINDSTSRPQGYVRCDMWIKAWSPTGPFEIDVRTSQPNMWNAISVHSEQYNTSPGRWATLCTVMNGSTVIQNAGGLGDHRTRTIHNANFDTATCRITAVNGSLFPQQGIVFVSSGTLPAGIAPGTIYWLGYPGTDNPFICTQRYFVSLVEQVGIPAAWLPNATYGLGGTCSNGNVLYICVQGGTSGSGGGPSGTGNAIQDGSCLWENVTVPFADQGSGKITAYPVNACFPSSAWITGDRHGNSLWDGPDHKPHIFPAHDFDYLTTKSKFVPCYNIKARFETTNQTLNTYAPNQNFGGILWYQSTTGDGAGDQRIGYVDGWGVAALMNPADPWYIYSSIQSALSYNNALFSYMIDERGGMPFVGNNGPKKDGRSYKNFPSLLPNWSAGQSPSFGVGNWLPWQVSPWSGSSGYGGQYYVDSSHTPAPWQVPYLKTGRTCFLEQGVHLGNVDCFMQYANSQTLGNTTYYCVPNAQPGIQERAWAWALRSLCQAMFVLPATHGFEPVLRDYYNDNAGYHGKYYASYVPPEAVALGLLNCADSGGGGNGHIAPWSQFFVYFSLAMEAWRGGLTGARAGANWDIVLEHSNAFWEMYGSSLPGSMYYIGAYALVYGPNSQDLTTAYQTPLDAFNATYQSGYNGDMVTPYPARGLYDPYDAGYVLGANYPENCSWYGIIGRAALKMFAVAQPGNTTISGLLSHLDKYISDGTQVSKNQGGIQWCGPLNGVIENYQTFAIF